jgi:cyclophilin family peptidyl-prolyl cis-trans isomerase
MVAELFAVDAPGSCENFAKLVNEGFYKGKEFYRVVKGHVIQAGGEGKDAVAYTIRAEINEHKHITGALGMARGQELDSASTEFYICHAPRPHLDGKYTVFGQVIEGLDVLDKIGNTEVKETFIGPVAFHRPITPVVIKRITIEKR